MTKKDWDTFFDLIDKIVEGRGLSADEKAELVVKEAKDRGGRVTMNAEEFFSWNVDFDPNGTGDFEDLDDLDEDEE